MQKQTELLWHPIPYGLTELKKDAALRYSVSRSDSLLRGEDVQCCIGECKEMLPRRQRGEKSRFCPTHGISVSVKPTYIYKGAGRNFIVGNEVRKHISKVESWRLGFETSEDALSWNVFVGLYALGGLAEAFEKLTAISPTAEPELYMWGNRIDTECSRWLLALATALIAVLMIAVCGRHWIEEYSGLGKSTSTFLVSLGCVAVYYGILGRFFWAMIVTP